MEINELLTIIGVNVGLFAVMITVVVWVVNKLDTDVKSVSNQISGLSTRLDGHAQRIDQVYGIILQMLKDRK